MTVTPATDTKTAPSVEKPKPVAWRYHVVSAFKDKEGLYRVSDKWTLIPAPDQRDAHSAMCGMEAEPLYSSETVDSLIADVKAYEKLALETAVQVMKLMEDKDALREDVELMAKALEDIAKNATSEHYDAWCGAIASEALSERITK